jgi:hypothetical protein
MQQEKVTMKWIHVIDGGHPGIRSFAGLFLRTPRRTRFWGWGQPPLADPSAPSAASPANDDRPWAALGDWLRAAHAMFGSDRPQEAQRADSNHCSAEIETAPGASFASRK